MKCGAERERTYTYTTTVREIGWYLVLNKGKFTVGFEGKVESLISDRAHYQGPAFAKFVFLIRRCLTFLSHIQKLGIVIPRVCVPAALLTNPIAKWVSTCHVQTGTKAFGCHDRRQRCADSRQVSSRLVEERGLSYCNFGGFEHIDWSPRPPITSLQHYPMQDRWINR